MTDLRELYQDMILDHSKRPRNFRRIEHDAVSCDGYNPLCGDKVQVFLKMNGDLVEDVSFQGQGCAISTASASMMTEMIKGRTREEAEELFETFHGMLTGKDVPASEGADLGKLEVFAGVREFPMRVKCATLSWHAMHSALREERQPVSTE